MRKITNYIIEKLHINKDSKSNKTEFTDEELRNDYSEVGGAYTKAEKQEFCSKYDIVSNKIREIQLVILDKLRENRSMKKEYDENDIRDFLRYDLPEKTEKLEEYLDKEPKEFIEYVLNYYEEKGKKIHPTRQSIADKHILKRINQLKNYLKY